VREIFLADDVDTEVSRLLFGPDGTLYMSIGAPGEGPEASVIRAQHGNDYAGKIVRMNYDGSVPKDNPFVGSAAYKPYVFALGFRNVLGMALNPWTNEVWATEIGPQGGDELNVIRAGKNYGWPVVSYGSDYFGKRFDSADAAHGFEEPVWFWTPPISPSGTGDSARNLEVNLVPLADRRHLCHVARALDLAIYLSEEGRGVSRRIEDDDACGRLGCSLKAVHGAPGRIDEAAGLDDLLLALDPKADIAGDHVIGLIPRMLVGRRPRVLGKNDFHERPGLIRLVRVAQELHLRAHDVQDFARAVRNHHRLFHRDALLPLHCIDECHTV
jgi:hypothetical protein